MPENNKKSIELRKVINPDDEVYEFVLKVRALLATNRNSDIITFLLDKCSKIPLHELIQLSNNK
jgi:uncharacterized UBP type Zn finger protein